MDDHSKPTAVLVVHGIGEQMPMDTLRRFVRTVFGRRADGEPRRIYSKLDRESTFLDLRRLSLAAGEGRGRVDFFEVYWAPILSGGSAAAVLAWTLRVLVRRPQGAQMRRIVWTMRITLLVLALVAVLLYLWLSGPLRVLAPLVPVLLAVKPVVRGVGRSMLTETMADASRWFAPGPRDIPERDQVRRTALRVLEDLHRPDEQGEQRYGRVVVLGHSLGSVVAYDAVRLAFDRWREPTPRAAGGQALTDLQPAAWGFSTERARLLAGGGVDRFQHVQSQLHAEQRAQGVPWLVTDLVTAGSPMTHAVDLWSTPVAGFGDRVEDNEYPVCPPLGELQHDEVRRVERGRPALPGAEGRLAFYRREESGPLVAHEASPFASTRWTNLYVPMRPWLGGDPVGGPLAGTMGQGVRDIAVRPSTKGRTALLVPVVAHTWYWRRDPDVSEDDAHVPGAAPDAVLTLARVLDLGRRRPEAYEPAP